MQDWNVVHSLKNLSLKYQSIFMTVGA